MAHLDLTIECRTSGAIRVAKIIYYAARPFTGNELAGKIAWRVAWRLVKWRVGGGEWRRLSPPEASA